MVSLYGFTVDDLPVSLYHIVESITGRPQFMILWKLLMWPMELSMFLHTTTLGALGGVILTTLPNTVQMCTQDFTVQLQSFIH